MRRALGGLIFIAMGLGRDSRSWVRGASRRVRRRNRSLGHRV